MDLEKEKWVFVYEKRNYDTALEIFTTFQNASKQLKLKVEEPYWIELKVENSRQDLEEELRSYMMNAPNKTIRHPTVVVCLLRGEFNYPMYKEVLISFRMPSQVITVTNGRKFNLSKATNILR